jgi:NAD(P)-dependent dehydrogenase (short-subunit alcohol dehydrogenase family)
MIFAQYPSLAGRVVFVTGGGSGIGAAMVAGFALNDARVAFVDVDEAASEALVRELSGARHAPVFISCDLTDIAALQSAISRTHNELGPIAVLVNNAANDERHEVDEVTPEYWDRAMAVNLRHQFFAAQAVRAQMRELGHGSIINFSSIAWMGGGTRMVAYTSAKAAVIGLTRSLAREFGPDNIRVNAIAPGAVITPRQLRLWLSQADVEAIVQRQCLNARLLADDIARAALFLAADDSHMITKQCLTVDAGLR